MAISAWSILTGFVWGLGSGVGFMIWVLIRLLNFQKKEMERRHAWLRWISRSKTPVAVAAGPSEPGGASEKHAEDSELTLLLRTVDQELARRGCTKLMAYEVPTAVKVLEDHKNEGHPQVAILQVVFDIQLHRRRRSREQQQRAGIATEATPGASSSTSIGSTVS